MKHDLFEAQITEEIIGSAFEVYNSLGYGFLEKVYQKAMQVELKLRGFHAEREGKLQVKFKGHIVGDYFADLIVEEKVVVEIKVSDELNPIDMAQLLNELKSGSIKTGILINLGKKKVEFKRLVY